MAQRVWAEALIVGQPPQRGVRVQQQLRHD
jgi:hypothetical protein